MALQQFVAAVNNHFVDVDNFPKDNPYQCVDLIKKYNTDVIKNPVQFHGNAIDYAGQNPGNKYRWVRNTPAGAPKPGSVMVFGAPYGYLGGRYYGHVGIVLTANTNQITMLNQNNPNHSATHISTCNYTGVIGWLEPLVAVNPAPTPAPQGGVIPAMRSVRVITGTLNVRTGPGTNFPLAKNPSIPQGVLHQGQVITVTGWEHAQNVGGFDVWLRTVNNHWIWAHGTSW